MDWQAPAALVIVAITAALMVWRGWRRRAGARPFSGCEACPGSGSAPRETVIVRGRRGQRPEIVIRPPRPPAS